MENIYAAPFEAASLSNSSVLLSDFAVNEEHHRYNFLFCLFLLKDQYHKLENTEHFSTLSSSKQALLHR